MFNNIVYGIKNNLMSKLTMSKKNNINNQIMTVYEEYENIIDKNNSENDKKYNLFTSKETFYTKHDTNNILKKYLNYIEPLSNIIINYMYDNYISNKNCTYRYEVKLPTFVFQSKNQSDFFGQCRDPVIIDIVVSNDKTHNNI